MKLAMIGLGKMGGNMAERLLRDNHEVVVFDISEDAVKKYENKGAIPSSIPLYGPYQRFKYTNWTQKFYCDATMSVMEFL